MTQYAYDNNSPALCRVFAPFFKVGAAINTRNMIDSSTKDFMSLDKQFNIFTLENESKPEEIHPEEGRWYFDKFDKFVSFGKKYDKALRGHTLIWHSQCPDWFFTDDKGDTAASTFLIKRVHDHVSTAVSRYNGKITTWDVVNEVLHDGGGMRKSKWYDISGEDYIKEAFRSARECDPAARLIINDYNLESSRPKAETMYEFVKKMILENVPIDGIGLQMHLSLDTDMKLLRDNVLMLSELRKYKPELKLEVTELDMTLYPYTWEPDDGEISVTKEISDKFTAKYVDLFQFYLELSKEGLLDTVVFWGLNDGLSWLNGFPKRHRNEPLLIGRDYVLKPAFDAVCELI